MVFLNYLIALAFLCFSFGMLLILISRSNLYTVLGNLFLILAGILILSQMTLSSETVVFFILGLIFILISFFFSFRDQVYLSTINKSERRESNE